MDVLALLLGQQELSTYEIVRNFWSRSLGRGGFEEGWQRILHDGVIADTQFAAQQVSLTAPFAQATNSPAATRPGDEFEIIFRPDPSIWDGRFCNNSWLQELQKQMSTLTWDNVAIISPRTAVALRIAPGMEDLSAANGVWVDLDFRGRKLRMPAWVMPGHPDGCVSVYLGYGRDRAGTVGNGRGFNAYAIRTSDAQWFGQGLKVAAAGVKGIYPLAARQRHQRMEGRDVVRSGASVNEFEKTPEQKKEEAVKERLNLYPEWPGGEPEKYAAWGMVIDLTACIGCNACVVACQSENNIAVVGKEQVIREREMHWLRVDTYHNDLINPRTYFQPVPCMHCEKAPCELVCPVEATTHSVEGINEMTYNRCVGTRYCSNNCPYKVRRFNFFNYNKNVSPQMALRNNPT